MKRAHVLIWTTCLLTTCTAAHADISDATITRIQGEVSLIHDGTTVPATEGILLKEGDTIRTADGGTADFSMNALAGCRVFADSEVQVKDPKKKTMLVKLSNGKAVFNLEKLPQESSFRVETPTAVAAVRGTQFSGNVSKRGSTFAVRDDAIEIFRLADGRPVGEPVTIGEGFSCDVTGSGFDTHSASGAELASMEQVASIRTCS